MELRHLRYFCVLADELHFGRAAARLSISQPPLSVAIRQLEDSIGARLFERNSKEVRLTAAGHAMRASAHKILAQAEEAALEARDTAAGLAGRLRIGFVGAMLYRGLPQALRNFQARYPGVRIKLMELNSGEQITELMHGRLDLGFIHTSRMPEELDSRLLLSEPFVCCLPARHRLARKPAVRPQDLADEPLVLFAHSVSPDYYDRILSICAEAGFRPDVRHEVRHWLAVVSLVSQGLGVALVPQALERSMPSGAVFRPLAGAQARSDTYGVSRRDAHLPLVARLFDAFDAVAAGAPAVARTHDATARAARGARSRRG